LETFQSQANSAAQHARFHNGCIADTLFTKLFYKSFGNLKYAAIFGNILAHDDKSFILFKCFFQAKLNSINKTFFGRMAVRGRFLGEAWRCKETILFFLAIKCRFFSFKSPVELR